MDRNKVTFRSKAEALACPLTRKARVAAPYTLPELATDQQRRLTG